MLCSVFFTGLLTEDGGVSSRLNLKALGLAVKINLMFTLPREGDRVLTNRWNLIVVSIIWQAKRRNYMLK